MTNNIIPGFDIKSARVFESFGSIEINYFDAKERWVRISDGIDTYDDLTRGDDESETEFLIRLKEFVWDKYLKPTKDRIAKLLEDES